MPKREWVPGFRGRVWKRDSVVPGSDPPRKVVTFYISYRGPGERHTRDEKVSRKPATSSAAQLKKAARAADDVLTSRLEGRTLPVGEARRQEAEAAAAAERNKPVLFSEYAQRWLDGHISTNCKPSTKRGYASLLDNLILPVLKDRPLAEITRKEIRELAYSCLEGGRKHPKKLADGGENTTLSPRSISYALRTISAIFNHAIEDGIVAANPALRPSMFIKTGPRREKVNVLTMEEGDLLLETAERHYKRIFPLLLCAMRTGMRQGELLALEWTDIDWNGNFIEVSRSTWRGITGTPKSGKSRRVDMNDRLKAVLTAHKARMAAEALKREKAEGKKEASPLIFTTSTGEPYDGVNARHGFERVLTKAGLRKIRFHDLRHSYASWLIANGESLAYVKDQLGHSSISITVDLYGHLVPGANRQAVQRLDPPMPMVRGLAGEEEKG